MCEEGHWMTSGRGAGMGTRAEAERPGWSRGERRLAWGCGRRGSGFIHNAEIG